MTPSRLIAILVRRWYVLLAGILCSLLAFWILSQSETVYAAQSDLVFLAPGLPGESRHLTETESQTLIDFTAIVERKVLAGSPSTKLASPTATLFGTGIREGRSINMLDTGGQWVSSFSRPVLSVQVAGPSRERVSEGMEEVLAEVRGVSAGLQTEAGADPASFITVERSPEELIITSFDTTRTGQAKALVALAINGLALSCAAAVAIDAAATRGGRRKTWQE